MSFSDDVDQVIAERYRISMISDGEWDYAIQLCWDRLAEILERDMDRTIEFLDNECREDQFAWMSDVYDLVAKDTKSKEFVDALYRAAEKYRREVDENGLMYLIDLARKEVE